MILFCTYVACETRWLGKLIRLWLRREFQGQRTEKIKSQLSFSLHFPLISKLFGGNSDQHITWASCEEVALPQNSAHSEQPVIAKLICNATSSGPLLTQAGNRHFILINSFWYAGALCGHSKCGLRSLLGFLRSKVTKPCLETSNRAGTWEWRDVRFRKMHLKDSPETP